MSFSLCKRFLSFCAGYTLRLIFPPSCPLCNARISEAYKLCSMCWNRITLITDPYCEHCSMPFTSSDFYEEHKCNPVDHSYKGVKSVILYDRFAAQMISSFKFEDRTELCETLSNLIVSGASDLLEESDVLIPVPMHKSRFRQRMYNQSAMLAKSVAQIIGKQAYLDCLIKVRDSKRQSLLSLEDRYNNLKNAFQLNKKYSSLIKGKVVAVIDDVMTTGTTTNECCKVLLRHGADKVYVVTLAKTLSYLDNKKKLKESDSTME